MNDKHHNQVREFGLWLASIEACKAPIGLIERHDGEKLENSYDNDWSSSPVREYLRRRSESEWKDPPLPLLLSALLVLAGNGTFVTVHAADDSFLEHDECFQIHGTRATEFREWLLEYLPRRRKASSASYEWKRAPLLTRLFGAVVRPRYGVVVTRRGRMPIVGDALRFVAAFIVPPSSRRRGSIAVVGEGKKQVDRKGPPEKTKVDVPANLPSPTGKGPKTVRRGG